jgi:hypothetical protein
MKTVYLLIILSLVSLMSYEFYFFTGHYAELEREFEIIKSVCKVDIG